MGFQQEMEAARSIVEARLQEFFAGEGLEEAMRYSLLAGGKRIRPILTMKFCEASGGTMEEALDFGCGVEMLHTYSLMICAAGGLLLTRNLASAWRLLRGMRFRRRLFGRCCQPGESGGMAAERQLPWRQGFWRKLRGNRACAAVNTGIQLETGSPARLRI